MSNRTIKLIKRVENPPYLSDFFERNRMNYYNNLTIVREKNNINQWLKFFLVSVIETAKNSINIFGKILQLQKKLIQKFKLLEVEVLMHKS